MRRVRYLVLRRSEAARLSAPCRRAQSRSSDAHRSFRACVRPASPCPRQQRASRGERGTAASPRPAAGRRHGLPGRIGTIGRGCSTQTRSAGPPAPGIRLTSVAILRDVRARHAGRLVATSGP
jgi:hypothetical protein